MSEKPNDVHKQTTEAQYKLLGKRFCSSCQAMKPIDDGEMVGTKVRRWKCSVCIHRQSVRKYQKEKAHDED